MRRILLATLLTVTLTACSRQPALTNTRPSAEALAEAVLEGLARSDREDLEALALSEEEFREHVWPELPAARPERNLPFSYVWGDLRQKSGQSLGQVLAKHGGHRYQLVSVRFDGETTPYSRSQVHRETVLRVRDAELGETDIRVFGSSYEQAGQWKVFSYVVE